MEQPDPPLDHAIAAFSAAAESGDLAGAAAAFGRELGDVDAGIGPALEDLELVHRIATGEDPGPDVIRAFAEAWADATLGLLLDRGALDLHTGLATTAYLATRLRDLAREGMSRGSRLVVAERHDSTAPRLRTMLRAAHAAEELTRSFPGAETPVGIGATRLAAIVPDTDSFDADLARARLAIASIDGFEDVQLRADALPVDTDEVAGFLRKLRGA